MLLSPFQSSESNLIRKHASSSRSKTQDKHHTKRTSSTIQTANSQSLPKLKSTKRLLPLQKSLLFLGWNSTKNKNILPVIQERRNSIVEPKRNMRMFRRYTTDQDEDQSESSSNQFKTIHPMQYKPLVRSLARDFQDTSERLLNEESIRTKLNQPIAVTATLQKGDIFSQENIPLKYVDRLIEEKEKKANYNKYESKLKNIRVESSSVFNEIQDQIKQQKTIFDQFRIREKIHYSNSSDQKQSLEGHFPKTKIQNRELTKIPSKQKITDFIQSYNSLEEGFHIPVDDPEFIVIWGKKDLYVGQSKIQNGIKIRSGKGILLTQHSHFEGQFENNQKKTGYQLRNNGIYKGQFSGNKRCGKGQFIWFNGQYYNGQWKDNQKHGSGIWTSSYTQPNPDTYIGEWKNGKVDGYGVHTWKGKANKYQGEFIDYLKHGKGIQKFENGDKYQGEYRNGKPEGYGQYFWSDGSYYKGNFFNGLRQMQGIYCQPNGNKYEGQYKNDCKHGNGKIYYIDGSIFKGMFVANKKQGEGQLRTKKGEVIKGYWRNGKLIQLF